MTPSSVQCTSEDKATMSKAPHRLSCNPQHKHQMQTEPQSCESCGIEDLVEDPLKKALQDLQISPGSNAGSSVYVVDVPEKAEWEESLKAEPVQGERGEFNLEEQDKRAWSAKD